MQTKYCSSPAGVLEKTPWVTAFHLAEEYQRRSDLFDMELHKTLVAAHNTNDIFFRQRYALVLLGADCSLFRNSFFFYNKDSGLLISLQNRRFRSNRGRLSQNFR